MTTKTLGQKPITPRSTTQPITQPITRPITHGLNHLGLAVLHLEASRDFFVDRLGWTESGRDDSYPRTAVTDGCIRFDLVASNPEFPSESFRPKKERWLTPFGVDGRKSGATRPRSSNYATGGRRRD